jgi:hypothetical protein
MSNNAGVTVAGGEMGRAQFVPAEAAAIEPHTDTNPVLLKPEADRRNRVILDARVYGHIDAANWRDLKDADLVNLAMARHTSAPCLLVGDIDRGGVFAALAGTMLLLDPQEQVQGLLSNRFRATRSCLETQWSVCENWLLIRPVSALFRSCPTWPWPKKTLCPLPMMPRTQRPVKCCRRTGNRCRLAAARALLVPPPMNSSFCSCIDFAIRNLGVEMLQRCLIALALVSVLSACGQNYSEQPAAEALAEKNLTPIGGSPSENKPSEAVAQIPAYGETSRSGQLQSWNEVEVEVPASWQSEKPASSMRLAQYAVPAAHGGVAASLAVFGGTMGSVDDNITRWIGQFSQPDGSDSAAKARRWTLQSRGGLQATLVDVAGTYNGGMGMSGGEAEQDFRVLGAIVETGSTYLYLKLIGPVVEIADLEEGFEAMVGSMQGA